MAEYKIVNASQLDSDLTSVANAIRTSKKTSETLEFPNGFIDAVNEMVIVQKYQGSYTFGGGLYGVCDVECGFVPDVVIAWQTSYREYSVCNVTEYNRSGSNSNVGEYDGHVPGFIAYSSGTDYGHAIYVKATDNGFRITAQVTKYGNYGTISYVAIKYTS